jgi:NADPH:quinone reductase-like Zn-dependent oxidoreductase
VSVAGHVMATTATSSTSVRAYVGTPAGRELQTVPEPQPAPGEALAPVEAFAVNRGELGLFDRFQRSPQGWQCTPCGRG